ncbi:DUF2512 family protein [Fredinandcohnia sp. 179-A 10B2 NHS]|uniref:DUF2512 family protein n=1 Tax=Fredinandcohnia sp. 179-A 10B2 NHS TaxID=3235176 RepID=UPI0039A24B2F
MSGFFLKIIVLPLVVAVCAGLFGNVDYVSWYQPIVVGIILAIVGHLMEVMMLRRTTTVMTDIVDFVSAAIVVYFVSAFMVGAEVTFWGAILTALVITLIEIPVHRWLVRTRQTGQEA